MNSTIRNDFFQDFYFAIFCYSLLIVVGGYEVGIGDQAEFLPYSIYLHNKTLYPSDLYIQGMESMFMNERYFFVHLVNFLVPVLEPAIAFLHFVFAIILITGMLRFARLFVENRFLRYAVVILVLIISYGINTGGNELYYNNFQGASIAKALCIWALCFLIERKYIGASLLTIAASLFQPLVGFHFFILSTIILVYRTLVQKEEKIQLPIFYILAFSGTAGLYIACIKLAQDQQILARISDKEFINIAYYFSMPHHFIPSYLSKKGILLSSLLLLGSIYFYREKSKLILIFLLTILLGIAVYIFGTYALDSFLIMSSWWFRTTIWIKIIGFVALAGIVTSYFDIKEYVRFKKPEKYFFIVSSILLFICAVNLPDKLPFQRKYHSFANALKNPDVEICNQIKGKVPVDAVFIQPALFSALKYYGQKSSYVEYLTPSRRKDYLKIWYQRIVEVYQVRYQDIPPNTYMLKSTKIRENLIKHLDENFKKHNKASLSKLKSHGVTHIITFKDHSIDGLEIIAENNSYKVYKL